MISRCLWYRDGLVAVQNYRGIERVMRYRLNARGDSIVHAEVLERNQDVLRVPTTGVIVGSRFYYIANSQFDRLDADNQLRPAPADAPHLSIVRVINLESRN